MKVFTSYSEAVSEAHRLHISGETCFCFTSLFGVSRVILWFDHAGRLRDELLILQY